jgi:chromosome partitioning protein
MHVLALINNKGGVGKTTTAVSLAAAWAASGHRVLLIDLDGQGSASLAVGLERSELRSGAAGLLYDGVTVGEVALPVAAKRLASPADNVQGTLDIVPGPESLRAADLRLGGEIGRERILRQSLRQEGVLKAYDAVILDCPPALGILAANALCASDGFLVPVRPHYLALEGLGSVLDAADLVRTRLNADAKLTGIVVTQADFRSNATADVINVLQEEHGGDVLSTIVRVNVRLAEAPSYGRSIFAHAPSSHGAEAYRALADEVWERITY